MFKWLLNIVYEAKANAIASNGSRVTCECKSSKSQSERRRRKKSISQSVTKCLLLKVETNHKAGSMKHIFPE
jgi:hypothetical protein